LTLLELISKLELAIVRRTPFSVQSAYVPALKQVVEFPKHFASSYQEIFIQKAYQPMLPLSDGSVVVDLGTNLGVFAMYVNQRLRNAIIYCFEANPKLFPYLQTNLDRMPDYGNKIKAFNVAISDEEGSLQFTMDHANIASVASTACLDTSCFPDAANYRPIKVQCNKLDNFVSSRIDFLKCDIEGAEYGVLEDALLSPDRLGQAAIEFHDVFNHLDEFGHIIETAFKNQFMVHIVGFGEVTSPEQTMRYCVEMRRAFVIKLCSQALFGRLP
jgi:FkbM family methyltransferase